MLWSVPVNKIWTSEKRTALSAQTYSVWDWVFLYILHQQQYNIKPCFTMHTLSCLSLKNSCTSFNYLLAQYHWNQQSNPINKQSYSMDNVKGYILFESNTSVGTLGTSSSYKHLRGNSWSVLCKTGTELYALKCEHVSKTSLCPDEYCHCNSTLRYPVSSLVRKAEMLLGFQNLEDHSGKTPLSHHVNWISYFKLGNWVLYQVSFWLLRR